MLRSLREIRNYSINAVDGEIGKAHEFYFDDQTWDIRYLVVDVGNFLMREQVLIRPEVIKMIGAESIDIGLSREQIKNSPSIENDKPVSLQQLANLHDFYGWPYYWSTSEPFPDTAPTLLIPPVDINSENDEEEQFDIHLRSSREVIGYHIQATDGKIGHIDDFILDTDCMCVRYLIADTKDWLPGKKVIISPAWVKKISWAEYKFFFDIEKEKIKESPEYNPELEVNREYESMLYDFYGKPKYWVK